MSNDKIDFNDKKTLEIVYTILKNMKQYEGWYTNPYDDYGVDFIIDYSTKKVIMSRTKGDEECLYEGTIYIKIENILIGYSSTNEWEKVYYEDDLPESSWDDLKEDIQEEVFKFLPHVCLDVTLIFSESFLK